MAYPEYPATRDEWWRFVEENWDNLQAILYRYLPMNGHEILSRQDGGLVDEVTHLRPVTDVVLHTMAVEVARLKRTHNPHLLNYFQAAWGAAPDSPSIHENQGWGILCDLCSEGPNCFDPEVAA